jgi:hypothetical protein
MKISPILHYSINPFNLWFSFLSLKKMLSLFGLPRILARGGLNSTCSVALSAGRGQRRATRPDGAAAPADISRSGAADDAAAMPDPTPEDASEAAALVSRALGGDLPLPHPVDTDQLGGEPRLRPTPRPADDRASTPGRVRAPAEPADDPERSRLEKLRARYGVKALGIEGRIRRKEKFGDPAWRPRRKLSREDMETLRSLQDQMDNAELAQLFAISKEAVSRILRSKWRVKG